MPQSDDPIPPPRSPDRRAFALLALLTCLNVLSWIDRQIIPSVAPLLMAELGLTSAQIGLLYGYAFILCFIVAGTVLGTVADRVHRPRLIAAGLAVWSVFTALSGLARSFAHLAGARVMVGVGEATLTPAALAILSDVFPEHWRARAAGIFAIGLPIGAGLSLIIAGILAPRYGWRACFLVLGILGVLAAFIVAFVPDVERRAVKARPPSERHQPFRDFLGTLRHSPALALTITGGVIITFSAGASVHVITWLVRERGYEFREAAILGGGLFAVTGTIGNIGGGWWADFCAARWRGGRLWSMVIAQVVLVPTTLLFFLSAPGSAAFYVGWVLSGLRGTIWFGPLYVTVQDLAPAHARATAVAFLMLAINLLGGGPGPWLAGAIGDRWTLTHGLLVTTGIGVLAIVPFALAARAAPIHPPEAAGPPSRTA